MFSDNWIRRFFDMAVLVSSWSKDPSTKVGAVIVRADKTIASVGFNGFPRGVKDSPERLGDRDLKYPRIVHAEINAILNCKERPEGHTIFVTPLAPCAQCTAAVIQSGIKQVFTTTQMIDRWKSQGEIGREMFQEAGVEFNVIDWYI